MNSQKTLYKSLTRDLTLIFQTQPQHGGRSPARLPLQKQPGRSDLSGPGEHLIAARHQHSPVRPSLPRPLAHIRNPRPLPRRSSQLFLSHSQPERARQTRQHRPSLSSSRVRLCAEPTRARHQRPPPHTMDWL